MRIMRDEVVSNMVLAVTIEAFLLLGTGFELAFS
jgi:hypothetical protein